MIIRIIRLRLLIVLVMLTSLLTACGPVYQSHYTYQAPTTRMDQKCAAQCMQGKSSCLQICDLKNLRCVQRVHQDAEYRYQQYRQTQLSRGARVTKSLRQFEDRTECRKSCTCRVTFNTCYSACGGQVFEHKKCIAFCDE